MPNMVSEDIWTLDLCEKGHKICFLWSQEACCSIIEAIRDMSMVVFCVLVCSRKFWNIPLFPGVRSSGRWELRLCKPST